MAHRAATPRARVAVWTFSPDRLASQGGLDIESAPMDAVAYGRRLYAVLNDWDRAGYDLLCLEAPPVLPEWEAVHDRLRRAAFSFTNSSDN
jgi:L-threonylcarbamoyladenylate synthase